MKAFLATLLLVGLTCTAHAQTAKHAKPAKPAANDSTPDEPQDSFGDSSLTIGKDFAVVRSPLLLDLKAGENEVKATDVTQYVETDSVIVRDAAGKRPVQILEQNYDGAITSEQEMLSKYEGQTLSFHRYGVKDADDLVQAKVLRATVGRNDGYGSQPQVTVIEWDGKIYYGQFGAPIFPADAQKIALRPTLRWTIYSSHAEKFPAEFSYITGGFSWAAAYNVLLLNNKEAATDNAALVGWLTLQNESGTEFDRARLRLFAGDIQQMGQIRSVGFASGAAGMAGNYNKTNMAQPVNEKPLDEYHVYDVARPTTLRNHETKQVEFLNADDVKVERVYQYEGQVIPAYVNQNDSYRQQRDINAPANTKVSVVHVIKNTKANHLGKPLPGGRVRFYREDSDGAMEFVGEDQIGHTPADETLRLTTGAAFDIVGDRKQTDFREENGYRYIDESFDIVVRNHKDTPVNVDVVEHLWRYANWDITKKSQDFEKRNSATAVFPVAVPAHGENKVSYTVHYTW